MGHVALGLGSNLAPPEAPPFDAIEHADARARALEGALALLESGGLRLVRTSRLHDTAPVGLEPGAPGFLNAAVLVVTRRPLLEVLEACRAAEHAAGRRRRAGAPTSRALDVDVLAAWDSSGQPVLAELPSLRVPHPRLAERAFALIPLAEVAGSLRLPDGTTPEELLARLGPAAAQGVSPGPASRRFPAEGASGGLLSSNRP